MWTEAQLQVVICAGVENAYLMGIRYECLTEGNVKLDSNNGRRKEKNRETV